jgi:PKD repeat protein
MKRNTLSLLSSFLFFALALSAQNKNACWTDEYAKRQVQANPAVLQAGEMLEQEIQRRIGNGSLYKTQSDFPKTRYVIPCVVHLVHRNDIAPSDTLNIIRQVESQFTALFNDYRRVPGTNGWGAGVDMEIEFTLASKNPQGAPTRGVTFIKNVDLADLNPDTEDTELKRTGVWPRTQYLNIWLVDNIGSNPQEPTLGYAQFPNFPPGTDGIVLRRDCFGTVGRVGGPSGANNLGRTFTHELGHWLNLFHPFQGGCGNSSCLNSGDRVCDTPPTIEANFGLGMERQNTCTNDAPDLPDNPRNYMDYLDDAGLNYFTEGQKARCIATLETRSLSQRYNLWQESNLRQTGAGKYKAPIANFSANNLYPCRGSVVTFLDYSRNEPTQFQWEFPGGSPSTSTEANPKVTYNAPGNYDVKLTVSNLSGQSHTITKRSFIQVAGASQTLPFSEGFGSTAFPPPGWKIENPDSAASLAALTWTWRRLATRGGFGRSQGCATIPCFRYSDYNQLDGLRTPPLDLKNITGARLTFSVAYLPLNYFYAGSRAIVVGDTLSVLASSDCGATWQTLYKKGGIELSKVRRPSNVEVNLPENSDWRTDTVRLDGFVGKDQVVLKFEMKNNFGNHIFIDDIVVEQAEPSSIAASILSSPPVVMPNPTRESATLIYNLQHAAHCAWEVIDMQGRVVARNEKSEFSAPGEYQIDIPLPGQGMYIVHLSIGKEKFLNKIIRY